MQNENLMVNSDLQTFIQKFDPSKFKVLSRGVEIRGIHDLHGSIARANEIIQSMSLRLTVNHNAEMLSYRGFEVNHFL